MSKLSIYSILLSMLIASSARAESVHLESGERQTILVELFTSQGCSSCPPAEKWLGDLKEDPGLWKRIIPVAFHVDYWDYIGWRDIYAKPKYSARQRYYEQHGRISSVYTPGFLVNGREWRGWFRGSKIPPTAGEPGNLIVDVASQQLSARFEPADPSSFNPVLNIALLGVGLTVDVARGENAGRRLHQDFVALELLQLESEDHQWSTPLPQPKLPAGSRLAIAAWVSMRDRQVPINAVGGWLPADF